MNSAQNSALEPINNAYVYKFAKEYTDFPGPRYAKYGEKSGEDFRDTELTRLLNFARKKEIKIVLDMDGTYGIPVSFTEEAFGGLQRVFNTDNVYILDYFKIKSNEDPLLVQNIQQFVDKSWRDR